MYVAEIIENEESKIIGNKTFLVEKNKKRKRTKLTLL